MSVQQRVLSLLAHPDDESYLCAGVLAAFQASGAVIRVVSATRGEAGEIAAVVDASPETLGDVREKELRQAMAELGIADVQFLGYRDSGMAGTPENEHHAALAQVPVAELGTQVAAVFDRFRPTVVITFGPEGVYQHPDHVAVHHGVMHAIGLAASQPERHRPDVVLFTAIPREWFIQLRGRPEDPFAGAPDEVVATMGTPRDEITYRLDVGAFVPRKRKALARHRTQFGDEAPLHEFDPQEARELLQFEHFVQVRLPWDTATPILFALPDPLVATER